MKNHEQLISVIMPAYNAAMFIEESINSVVGQTYINWELIIVDDGSTDATKAIIQSFIKKDSRICYVYQQNGRQGKARNTGIAQAKSSLIAFLDADDIWVKDMLEKQLALINESHADLVFGYIHHLDIESSYNSAAAKPTYNSLDGYNGFKELLKGNYIPIFTVLTFKDSILNAGGFKTSEQLQYGEDYDLWLRMLLNGARFQLNNEYLAYYRLHPQQSIRNAEGKYFQILEMIKNLPEIRDTAKEKRNASCIWIRRCLVNQKEIDRKGIRKLSSYIPSAWLRSSSVLLSFLIPPFILRKVIYKLSYYSQG